MRWRGCLMVAMLLPATGAAQIYLDDAERFARLLANTGGRPSVTELRRGYLEPGTQALREFAAERIGGAETLALALTRHRSDYEQALELCLPAAEALAARLPRLQRRVAERLGRVGAPAVSILFGAGRSGGTVTEAGVSVALEVLCWFALDAQDAEALLEEFVVHETVHWHQLRLQQTTAQDSLLRQALIEGVADFLTGEMLGRVGRAESARHQYGLQHEKRLWQAFQNDMDGTSLRHWMYGPGAVGEPADLGYWIGKRIAQAYWQSMGREPAALEALLRLESPRQLLEQSGYDP